MRRRWFLAGGLGLFLLGLWVLGASPRELVPSEGGRRLALDFLQAAWQPAFDYEEESIRTVAQPFGIKVMLSAWWTVKYALAAMSLALLVGLVGGVLGSRAWWSVRSGWLQGLRLAVRVLATALRSVHELIWAILLLAALGTSPLAAILAMALPYGGTLAKVFSELLDEAEDNTAEVLRASGGKGMAAFLVTVAKSLPDLMTYAFYRLECAVRSSAVLGFVGVPTLGYEMKASFQDGHYREIWTFFFVLLGIVLFFEWWGGRLRHVMTRGSSSRLKKGEERLEVATLWRSRSRSLFLRITGVLLILLIASAWFFEADWGSSLSLDQRWENLQRFGQEVVPYPVQQSGQWADIGPWMGELMREKGGKALWRTFHLGTAATLLAGAVALLGLGWTARSLATGTPREVPVSGGRGRRIWGRVLRGLATVGRSVPEYLLAFLLLQIFGPTVWALILALAIHNSGILSRLGSEVIDNQRSGAAEAILTGGGSRMASLLGGLLPGGFNRMVLFLFYRWETCIREATILGMLGVSSLGYLISDARASFYYDELILWVVAGASLVMAGDLLSDWIRWKLRQS